MYPGFNTLRKEGLVQQGKRHVVAMTQEILHSAAPARVLVADDATLQAVHPAPLALVTTAVSTLTRVHQPMPPDALFWVG